MLLKKLTAINDAYIEGQLALKIDHPGIAEHGWAEMRGMLPTHTGESVYLTAYTPFRHTLHLK